MSLQHPAEPRPVTVVRRFGPALAFGALVMLLAGAATLLRQTGIPKVRTMWAEDARVFTMCAYNHAALDCLLRPYQGYLHLVPRIGAQLAVIGPPEGLPLRVGALSAIVAGAATLVAARAVLRATRSWAAGLITAVAILFTWLAAIEVGGNLTNLHWMLLAAAAIVLVSAWLGARPGIADGLLVAFTTVSSALGLLLIPLAIVPVVQRRARARLMLATTAAGAGIQALVMLTSQRAGVGRPVLGVFAIVRGSIREVVVNGWFGPDHRPWNVAVALLAGLVVTGMAVVPRRSARRDRALAMLSAAVLVAFGFVVYWAAIVVNRTTFSYRYGYEPSALVLAALAIGLGLLAARPDRPLAEAEAPSAPAGRAGAAAVARWRPLVPWLVGAVLVLGFALTFDVTARASPGPDAAVQLERGRVTCATVPGRRSVHVVVSPDWRPRWFVDVPCDAYGPQARPATGDQRTGEDPGAGV